jgi:Protein of unknown function (DUF3631)
MCLSAAIEISGEFDEQRSIAIQMLSRIRTLFAAEDAEEAGVLFREGDGKFLPSTRIIAYLNSDEEAPWADWKTGDKTGITIEKLSYRLRELFKIKSEQVEIDGKRFRGYWLKSFKEAFESFLQPEKSEEPTP